MTIMLITVPIRPVPTNFPPIGSLSIINHVRKHAGIEIDFYNIDAQRPAYEEVIQTIIKKRPTVLGISAVVSTSYAYTKRLTLDIKKFLPDTLIVVGGNMVASAEVLLRRTGTDLCVTGEGESVFLDIIRRAKATVTPEEYTDIPGLILLGTEGRLVNTGYPDPLDKKDLYDIDWSDLESSSDIDLFLIDTYADEVSTQIFSTDPRFSEQHRKGKMEFTLPAAKGCVARCTFCHRFDKGIRYIPVDTLMSRIETLIERYNVGFLRIGDENFGTDKRWLREFCDKIRKYDLLWHVGGMRVNCITPEYIDLMKDAGCVTIHYGMESGSQTMLDVMEKKTTIQQNRDAMKWTVDAKLWTSVQLVLGMPGESPETVKETINFTKYAVTLNPNQRPNDLSINYAQALPGTPLYEFARHKEMIGEGLDGEEAYLERISNKDAHDEITTLNFTEFPKLECQNWRPRITIETNFAYVQQFGIEHYLRTLLGDVRVFKRKGKDTGYFANPKRLVDTSITTDTINKSDDITMELSEDAVTVPSLGQLLREKKFGLAIICYPVLAYRLRRLLPLFVLLKAVANGGVPYALGMAGEYIAWRLGLSRMSNTIAGRSLRKVMREDFSALPNDDPSMQPLRDGR